MKKFKLLSSKSILMLILVLVANTTFISCKDKDDEPKGSNELVGKWYFIYDNDIDYDDYYVFNNDGTGYYSYQNDPLNSDSFTYTFDPQTKIIIINYKHWGSTEPFPLIWLAKNIAKLDNGTYIKI